MQEEHVRAVTGHRVGVFSDAVIAVIMTVMVLELKAPEHAEFSALWPLWHTVVSYAVSYVFIAIVWINHHYLMGLVGRPTQRLIWTNFAHLFLVSFVPFATAWVARTQLAPAPSCSMRRSSWAWTLRSTSSSRRSWRRRMPVWCLPGHGAGRGVDR